jgi:hypothetical protein
MQLSLKQAQLPRENVAISLMRAGIVSAGGGADRLPAQEYDDDQMATISARGAAFCQFAMLYGFTWEDKAVPLMIEYAYLDATGVMIAKSRGLVLLAPNREGMSHGQQRQAAKELESIFLAFYFSLCLLHTKNVTLKDNPSIFKGKKKTKSREAKSLAARFKTLDIAPLKERVRHMPAAASDSANGEIQRALHLCRGHYRRCTEESKLFGKHTGIFWIPSHMRGSKDQGEVRKDYRVAMPQ